MPVIPAQTWSELAPTMQTGDLILFSGTSTESLWIEALTGGQFSHSTMVVRTAGSSAPWMWQEAPEAIAPDPRTGKPTTGAQLGDAEEATQVIQAMGDKPFYVRLDWDRPADLDDKILAIVAQYEGVPFGTVLQMALDYAIGKLYDQATGLTTMFCAELVAVTYQALGLLTEVHPPNWYSPNSFGPDEQGQLPWTTGLQASLAVPVPITLPAAPKVTAAAVRRADRLAGPPGARRAAHPAHRAEDLAGLTPDRTHLTAQGDAAMLCVDGSRPRGPVHRCERPARRRPVLG